MQHGQGPKRPASRAGGRGGQPAGRAGAAKPLKRAPWV